MAFLLRSHTANSSTIYVQVMLFHTSTCPNSVGANQAAIYVCRNMMHFISTRLRNVKEKQNDSTVHVAV